LLDLDHFFSFLILYTGGRTPWTGDQPAARPLPTHRTTQTIYTHKGVHTLSGIRTHDPSVRAGEDSTCLRPRGHCDRLLALTSTVILCGESRGSHDSESGATFQDGRNFLQFYITTQLVPHMKHITSPVHRPTD
jgi:hypothetical protein